MTIDVYLKMLIESVIHCKMKRNAFDIKRKQVIVNLNIKTD
jgi:hypothetical protein